VRFIENNHAVEVVPSQNLLRLTKSSDIGAVASEITMILLRMKY
jgi:hypothetical protein